MYKNIYIKKEEKQGKTKKIRKEKTVRSIV